MSVLLHFVRRDWRDHAVLWILAALLTLFLVVPVQLFRRAALDQVIGGLAASYFLFFTLYCQSVWGEGNMGTGLPRHYLRSLPLKRSRIFFLNMIRGSIGGIPLIVLGFLGWPARQVLVEDNLPLQWKLASGLSLVIVVLSIQGMMSSTAGFQEAFRRSASKAGRFVVLAGHIASILLDALPIGGLLLLPSIAIARQTKAGALATAAVLTVAFIGWRLVRSYEKWLWD